MRRIREYYLCDRCNKEIEENNLNLCYDLAYQYELCDECKEIFDKYKKELEKIDKKRNRIAKNFIFGKYLLEKIKENNEQIS